MGALCCVAPGHACAHAAIVPPLHNAGYRVFREALPCARLEAIPDEPEDGCQVLALSDAAGNHVNWPGLRSHKLLIRPVFREFFEREDILNYLKHRAIDAAPFSLVRGIPGIGKSSFALYCLWRLVTAGEHVLYSYPVGLGAGAVIEFGSGPPDDTIFIADGTDPFLQMSGKKLLVTSPRQSYIAEFDKHAESFYMPQPTRRELLVMRSTCFHAAADRLTDALVDERIARWGLVPRFTLAHAHDEAQALSKMVGKLNVTALRNLLQQQTEIRDQDDVSFRVLHYAFPFDDELLGGDDCTDDGDDGPASSDGVAGSASPAAPASYGWPLRDGVPQRDYTDAGLRWASAFMEDRVWDFFMQHQLQDRMLLLRDLFRDKAILKFSGSLWEKWASVVVARGGSFRVRRLAPPSTVQSPEQGAEALGVVADGMLGIQKPKADGDGDDGWLLRTPKASNVRFTSIADLQAKLTAAGAAAAGASKVRYVAPTNFAAIDFMEAQLPRVVGSNASVSDVHDLVMQGKRLGKGWRAIVAGVPSLWKPKEPLIHLWLVPGIIYPDVTAGALEIADKMQVKKPKHGGGAGAADGTQAAAAAKSKRKTKQTPSSTAAAAAIPPKTTQQLENEAKLKAFNDAVDAAKAMAPYVVQYAVELPEPPVEQHALQRRTHAAASVPRQRSRMLHSQARGHRNSLR